MEIISLLTAIEQLRKELHELIKEKETLLDEEILQKSRDFDRLLNEYADLLKPGRDK